MKGIIPLLVLILFFAGCSNEKNRQNGPEKREIKTINEQQLKEIIANRNGKILFLNVWATWCEPCVEEFPAIVQLDKNYTGKNVEIIGLSVDLPSDAAGKIIPFLKKQGADFKVYTADEKSSSKIIDMLNPDWGGAIPATFIFDKAGKQQKFLLGAQNYKVMSSVIDSVTAL